MPTERVPAVGLMGLLASLRASTGISCSNCSTCAYQGRDSDGGEPEYSISWPVCEKFGQYQYLKSFPFKKEMACWEPEFWLSKFTDQITTGADQEVLDACGKFADAVQEARKANAESSNGKGTTKHPKRNMHFL